MTKYKVELDVDRLTLRRGSLSVERREESVAIIDFETNDENLEVANKTGSGIDNEFTVQVASIADGKVSFRNKHYLPCSLSRTDDSGTLLLDHRRSEHSCITGLGHHPGSSLVRPTKWRADGRGEERRSRPRGTCRL